MRRVLILIFISLIGLGCGQTLKTKNEHVYHFDPIKIETSPIVISGDVYIKIVSALNNDPIIKDLINVTCQGKLSCNEETLQDLISSVTANLTSGTLPLEQPIK